MKFRLFNFFVLSCFFFNALGQDPVAQQYGNQISEASLKDYLTIIASDAMEGRETGKRGQKMAAAFISAHFNELGLIAPVQGSFYQSFDLHLMVPAETYMKTGSDKFMNFQDIVYYGKADSEGEKTISLLFAGKGREEDFNQIDVKDKGVLLKLNATDDFQHPVRLAKERGAKTVFILNQENANEFKALAAQFRRYLTEGEPSLEIPEIVKGDDGLFLISPVAAEKMMGVTMERLSQATIAESKKSPLKKLKPGSVTYRTSMMIKNIETENVLGYLEGSDKKDELIVITAHYDHIGKKSRGEGDRINNGADDDGSGTVTVMELARIFTQAKQEGKGLRRSILFMAVTGEELGLLGSDYYTQNPVYPLSSTVVNLNIDMIGRRDAQHKDSAPYLYVIGADKLSTELNNLSESINKTYTNLIFDYTYNDQNHPDRLYYRSDHWNFAKNNIPIIFYFDGIHEDYHRVTDEVEKIEFDLLRKRAQCIFYTAWEIANREQRIIPDNK